MKLNIKRRVLSIALATAMAFGFAVAPVPALLDGNHVAEATVSQVTVLPDPDKVGGLGTGANVDLGLDTQLTTISNNQVINNSGIVLLGFNKNVTTKNKKNPLPEEAIYYNSDIAVVLNENDDVVASASKVSPQLLAAKNATLPEDAIPYTVESYRNYIYLNTTSLSPGNYFVRISYKLISANATLDSNNEPIYTDSKSALVDPTPLTTDDYYLTIPFSVQ